MENTKKIEKENKKNIIPIRTALGLKNDLILFYRQDKPGLWLGTEENYKKLGEYTSELLKVCDNEETYILYSLFDIITKADTPEQKKRLKLAYYVLQMDGGNIEDIARACGVEWWQR